MQVPVRDIQRAQFADPHVIEVRRHEIHPFLIREQATVKGDLGVKTEPVEAAARARLTSSCRPYRTA